MKSALSEFSCENRGKRFVMFNFLCSLQDPELVWKYIDWVMERDDVLGVQVSNIPTCFLLLLTVFGSPVFSKAYPVLNILSVV